MNKSPAYRWYPKDIISSARVASMTAEEECWYRRALDFAWLNGGIPSDPGKLARMIGKGCTKGGARVVLEMFENSDDPNKKVSERQEIERQKQREWSEKSAAGGKASKSKAKKTNAQPLEQGGYKGGSTTLKANGQPKPDISFSFPVTTSNEVVSTHNDASLWEFPIRELLECFPEMQLTPDAAGYIEASVKPGDELAWANTLKTYRQNHDPFRNRYLPEKTGNLLNVFEAEKQKLEKAKQSAKPYGKTNFDQQRTDDKIREREAIERTRERVRQRDEELRGQGSPDR